MSQAPDGIDEGNVTEWMVAQLPEIVTPLTFTLIAGGRSNLTFRVEDAEGRAWALRRPPLHHVLPTAHDMSREYRLIHSLGPAGIPVPVTVGAESHRDRDRDPGGAERMDQAVLA